MKGSYFMNKKTNIICSLCDKSKLIIKEIAWYDGEGGQVAHLWCPRCNVIAFWGAEFLAEQMNRKEAMFYGSQTKKRM